MAIALRPFVPSDSEAAERVRRLAFGTLFGVPDPANFRLDIGLLPARCRTYPDGGFVAEEDGAMVGVAMANHWGGLGVFGPIAVDPAYWRRGVARQLLDITLPVFDRWGCRMSGLFTFPERPTHLRLYQSVGFWPRSLTAIMRRPVEEANAPPDALRLSEHASERAALIAQGAALTGSLFDGLDLSREIDMAAAHRLGDTVLLTEGSQVTGLALCHIGAGSEAGADTLYMKFAAVGSGPQAPQRFARLIDACNALAQDRDMKQLAAGVNVARINAYRLMMELGFRAVMQGIAMHRPYIEAYDRPEVFALDDWR